MKANDTPQALFGGRHCAGREHLGERRWDYTFPHWRARKKVKQDQDLDSGNEPLLSEAIQMAIRHTPNISVDPDVMQGQPCITGTRIPVTAVLRVLEHYGSLDEVVRCYPHLTKEHAKQALCFSQLVLEPPSGEDEFTHSA
jgi:uncharacterized protein (DUF433 family)